MHSRVCDRFFRGDSSHNGKAEDSSLCLNIAQWILTAHGRTIRVESLPRKLATPTASPPIDAR
jgi:signal transduction histidine kinase